MQHPIYIDTNDRLKVLTDPFVSWSQTRCHSPFKIERKVHHQCEKF